MSEYANEFILDEHDSGYFMAKRHKDIYPIGRDKEKAITIIKRLNEAHRPNLEFNGESLLVCWNDHDKGHPCEYEALVENAV